MDTFSSTLYGSMWLTHDVNQSIAWDTHMPVLSIFFNSFMTIWMLVYWTFVPKSPYIPGLVVTGGAEAHPQTAAHPAWTFPVQRGKTNQWKVPQFNTMIHLEELHNVGKVSRCKLHKSRQNQTQHYKPMNHRPCIDHLQLLSAILL